ncbi:hypothetical protein HF086_001845 [Spodoptera exigua]|uniref:Farnesyl pyrophosphate synthase n=1 Tax=Spodoptera exigua TaxID=7107 RepID=A0A922MA15_SPOEX|nr:hypothetical protein HF086_001845 [Spodoptera exigua]
MQFFFFFITKQIFIFKHRYLLLHTQYSFDVSRISWEMSKLLQNSRLFYNQLRQLHSNNLSAPTPSVEKEKKAFQDVLPEFIDSVITTTKIKELPEVATWMEQVLKYVLPGGKLSRGLITSMGYKMFEEPEHFSERTQHDAHILGWCIQMMHASFLVLDDIADGATMRHNKQCWHLQRNVGLYAVNDALMMQQAMMDMLKTHFGNSPIYIDLINYFNEDDYLDVYGDETITGKTARDIQEGKGTWLSATALQRCDSAQLAIFKEYFGSNNLEHVKRIKQLYDELNLRHMYEQYELKMYEDLMRRIKEVPHAGGRILLSGILKSCFQRDK